MDLVGGPNQPIVSFGAEEASPNRNVTPFISLENGVFVSSPLGNDQLFPSSILKNLINMSETRLIHAPSSISAAETAGAATVAIDIAAINANANNGARAITNAFFPFFMVQVSAPQLAALPAAVITVSPTVPYENNVRVALGSLVVSTIDITNRMNIICVPWAVIQGKPRATMGCIRDGQSLSVTVSGLATGSQVTLIIPGTTHQAIEQILSKIS
jgi:hypothetical protein